MSVLPTIIYGVTSRPCHPASIKDRSLMDFEGYDRNFPFEGYDSIDKQVLDTFPYEYPSRGITITITTEEFTALCPFSGLPDFGLLKIEYIPNERCIELRSLKYYLFSYRQVGIYYEHLVNRVLEDLVEVCSPISMTVTADYTPRGGFKTSATASWSQQNEESESKSVS